MPRNTIIRGRCVTRTAIAAFAPLLLLASFRLSADEGRTILTASAGLSRGLVRELVYEGDSILSELIWPLDNAVSFTLGADIPLRAEFRLLASLGAGMPMLTGSMEDSDFMNLPHGGEKTHYSRHDSLLRHSFALALALSRPWTTGLSGPLTERRLTVTPAVGARFSSRSWSARDGYLQYGEETAGSYEPWTPEMPRVPVSGTVITYELTSLSLSCGVSVLIPVADRWGVSLDFSGGPILWATGLDEHLVRSLTFKDLLSGGWFIEPALTLACSTGTNSALSLVVSWEKTSGLRGDTNIYEDGVPGHTTATDSGGSDSSVVTARLAYSVRLGRGGAAARSRN